MEPENDGLQLRNLLFQKSSSSLLVFRGVCIFKKSFTNLSSPIFLQLCVFSKMGGKPNPSENSTPVQMKFDPGTWHVHVSPLGCGQDGKYLSVGGCGCFTSQLKKTCWDWSIILPKIRDESKRNHHVLRVETGGSGWWWKKIKPYYTTNQSEPSPQTNHQSGFEVAFSKRLLSSTKSSTKKMKLHKHTLFSFKDLPFGCRCHKLSQLDLPSCPQFTHQVAIFIDFSEADLSCFTENWASHEPRTWWFVWGENGVLPCLIWPHSLTHSLTPILIKHSQHEAGSNLHIRCRKF